MQNSNIEVSYKFFVSYSLDLFLKGKCSVICFSVYCLPVFCRLGFFERKNNFYNQSQLTSEMGRHYAGQAVKQLYVLVLGLDVLGNPFGLLRGMAEGMEDLFYEPYQVSSFSKKSLFQQHLFVVSN